MEIWDLYFAQIVGMNEHPGFYRDNVSKLTLEDCADLVDEMMKVRDRRVICLR